MTQLETVPSPVTAEAPAHLCLNSTANYALLHMKSALLLPI